MAFLGETDETTVTHWEAFNFDFILKINIFARHHRTQVVDTSPQKDIIVNLYVFHRDATGRRVWTLSKCLKLTKSSA